MASSTDQDMARHTAKLRAKHRAALYTLRSLGLCVLVVYNSGHVWKLPALTAYRYLKAMDIEWDNSARRWKGKCNRVT